MTQNFTCTVSSILLKYLWRILCKMKWDRRKETVSGQACLCGVTARLPTHLQALSIGAMEYKGCSRSTSDNKVVDAIVVRKIKLRASRMSDEILKLSFN